MNLNDVVVNSLVKVTFSLSSTADETLATPEEIPEDVQKKLLADYEKECQSRLAAGDEKGSLKCKEKGDMVLVSRSGDSGSTSPGKGEIILTKKIVHIFTKRTLFVNCVLFRRQQQRRRLGGGSCTRS